jgi:hypothetical protein
MSSETTEESISTTTVDVAALPQVRKPGRVPIKSWVPDLEGSVLDQATGNGRRGGRVCLQGHRGGHGRLGVPGPAGPAADAAGGGQGIAT